MIDVTQEQLDAFLSSEQKELILEFEDGTSIDNNSIRIESMSLDQTLCDEEVLTFGKCTSNSFMVDVKASAIRYKGKKFTAKLRCAGQELQLGIFKVDSDNIIDDGIYRNLICYDEMFLLSDVDVTNWYNSLSFPIKMKSFRTSLINYLGLTQKEQTLCNDDMSINKTVNVVQLSAISVFEYICEINACFGKIDNEGKFKYVELDDVRETLYPSEELFPSEDLFPRTDASDTIYTKEYSPSALTYEEYLCQKISQVKIRETIDDLGTVVGEEGNLYTIEGNILCYGMSETEKQTVARNFLNMAEMVWYQPFNLTDCKGRPWLDVGDFVKVIGNRGVIRSVILHRTISGITNLRDNFSSQGLELYPLNNTSIQNQLESIRGASIEIKKEVDELTIEVKEKVGNEELSSAIQQSSESIMLEVNKKVGEDEVISTINISPERIYLRGNRLVIESTNFSLDKWGDVKVSGDIDAKNLLFHGSVYMVYGENDSESDKFPVISTYGVDTAAGTLYCNLSIGSDSFQTIGDGVKLTDTVEVLGDLQVDGKMYEKNNPYKSIGNNWYIRKLSENIYEYIYQGTIGDGTFSEYGNMYFRKVSVSIPSGHFIKNIKTYSANLFNSTGLFGASMCSFSSTNLDFYIYSAEPDSANPALNISMIVER